MLVAFSWWVKDSREAASVESKIYTPLSAAYLIYPLLVTFCSLSDIFCSLTVAPWCSGYHYCTASTKPDPRFCAGSNPIHGVLEIRVGEDLWQWSQLKIRLKQPSSVNCTIKTILRHHHHLQHSCFYSVSNLYNITNIINRQDFICLDSKFEYIWKQEPYFSWKS